MQKSAPLWPDFPETATAQNEPAWKRRTIRFAAALSLLASLAYAVWRPMFTMAHANPWLGALLYATELLGLASFVFYVHDLWQLDDRLPWHPPQRLYKVAVVIPTYNEPRAVLLPTVAAAITIRYPHETWVLDDGERPWVADMAALLGANYHTRPDHSHAKAGNINAVLPVLGRHGVELIVVFDADHVPKSTFLDHLMGYFDDPKVALVQTPQDYYNLNSFEHTRRWHGGQLGDQNLFYRIQETARNRNNSAFWCGTSAVVRLEALSAVGGVATDTVTEDMHTTIKLHKAGFKTVYHNEVLARGLAAANWEQFSTQRRRWAQGGMQILRQENLVTDKRLTVEQRISYFGGILSWFQSWYALVFLTVPIITVLTGALPMSASFWVFFPMWMGNLVVQHLAQRVLSRGAMPVWHAIVFSVLRIPAVLPATFTLFSHKPLGFKVTPKGKLGDTRRRCRIPGILKVLLVASAVALAWFVVSLTGHGLLHYHHVSGVCWAAGWTAFDLAALVAAVRRIRSDDFSSDRRSSFRFDLGGEVAVDGVLAPLKDLSLAGGRVALPEGSVAVGQSVTLEIPVVDLPMPLQFASVVRSIRPVTARDHAGGRFARPARVAGHEAHGAPGLPGGEAARDAPAMAYVGVEFIDSDTVEVALLAMNLFRTGASILVPRGELVPKRHGHTWSPELLAPPGPDPEGEGAAAEGRPWRTVPARP